MDVYSPVHTCCFNSRCQKFYKKRTAKKNKTSHLHPPTPDENPNDAAQHRGLRGTDQKHAARTRRVAGAELVLDAGAVRLPSAAFARGIALAALRRVFARVSVPAVDADAGRFVAQVELPAAIAGRCAGLVVTVFVREEHPRLLSVKKKGIRR